MQKVWKIKKKPPKTFLNKYKDYDSLLLQLLYNRKIKSKEQIEDFLSIDYFKDVHDPYLLSGMKRAVSRINKAIKNKEKIAIFGDYDADGVCSSTIINDTLKRLGSVPLIHIPDRRKGYGMNKKAIEKLADSGVSLIITVDCGASDREEVDMAKKLNIDVIITDHHLFASSVPKAYAILNPRKKNCSYPNKELSGAGVAFKLATALIKSHPEEFKEGEERWLLDLVAIATIADLMNLIGENRTLVKYGLLVLAKTKRLGLKALLETAGIKEVKIDWINKKDNRFLVRGIDAYTIGYIIGPRLNAAGRMDHANRAFYLLNTQSKTEARNLAKELNRKNQRRQKIQADIIEKIKKTLTEKELSEKRLIIRGDKSYPKGIVGLISGKLTDQYYLPSFIYQKENGSCRGSCRSIPGLNIVEILKKCSSCLTTFGGHKGAAGFSFKAKNQTKFKLCLEKTIKESLGKKVLRPQIEIDACLNFREITPSLKKTLEELEPFGQGNAEPIFVIKKALIVEIRKIGKKKNHLLLTLKKVEKKKDSYLRALVFKGAASTEGLEPKKTYDFAFTPLFDEWKGRKKVTLKIIDWKLN